jgi:hypothetical protein
MFAILQICDGAVGSLGEVWGQYAACRVAGLPAECGAADLRASIKGTIIQVENIEPADPDGNRTVNLRLPDQIATGYNPLQLEYAGASAELEVRVLGRRQPADE